MSIEALAERMNRLERQNRCLICSIVVFLVVGSLMGAAAATSDNIRGKTVTAEKFVLQNADGKDCAVLSNTTAGPYFALMHATGKPAVYVQADGEKDSGPGIWIGHEDGRRQVILRGSKESRPEFSLLGQFVDDKTKQGVYMGWNAGNNVPFIEIQDEGKLLWGVGGNAVTK